MNKKLIFHFIMSVISLAAVGITSRIYIGNDKYQMYLEYICLIFSFCVLCSMLLEARNIDKEEEL